MNRGRRFPLPLDRMKESELIRLDLRGYNRGQLQNYMLELQTRRRQKKKEMGMLDEQIRQTNITLTRGSVV